MIKMICCDLDGTLIPYGSPKIDGETFALIKSLVDLGVAFCPASGRQYPSLRAMFAPVADLCHFVCGNGAVVCAPGGETIGKVEMPRPLAEEISETFLDRSDGLGEVAINGEKKVYVISHGKGAVECVNALGEKCEVIGGIGEIKEGITKVSLFVAPSIAPYANRFDGLWKDASVAVAGKVWLDATCADKGSGVKALCERLKISTGDVAAFGDNWNDAPMLDIAGHPFIVKTADKPLLEMYPNHVESPQAEFKRIIAELSGKKDM